MRSLLFASVIIVATHAAYQLTGCAGGLRSFDQLNDPSDDATLARCRQEGRRSLDGGSTPTEAYNVYFDCTNDGGLR